MTDNDKNRIEEAAGKRFAVPENRMESLKYVLTQSHISAFQAGAEYERPIAHKEGWNEALDKLIEVFNWPGVESDNESVNKWLDETRIKNAEKINSLRK